MIISRWALWRVNLDPVVGSEQGRTRPVLIISETAINELLNTINIIPITSKKLHRKIYPNEVFIPKDKCFLPQDSILLCHQLRTIDKRRLEKYLGIIEENEIREKTNSSIIFQLSLKEN